MLSIIRHQRKANHNHNNTSYKLKKTSVRDVKKLEHTYTAAGNVKWYTCSKKPSVSPQKVKQSYHVTQQSHSYICTQKKKDLHMRFTETLFIAN